MEDVKSLILKFSKPELKYLKTLLNAFHGKSNENKMLELVELIEKKPDIQQSEASKKLYGDPKTKAFLVMKARLMERLYEVVLASPKIPNNPLVEEDENAYAYIQLQKDFALAIALRRRGLSNLSKEMLQECLKNPHTHLNPSFKVMLLEYFRTSVDNFADLEQINKDLEYAIPQQKLCIEARAFRDELRIAVKLKMYSGEKFIHSTTRMVEYLEDKINREQYYTPITHFNHLSNKIDLYSALKDYKASQKTLSEMSELITLHPLISTNNRKGTIFHHLAVNNLLMGNYSDALKNVQQSFPFFSNRPTNYWYSQVIASYAFFYTKEWNKSVEIYDLFLQLKIEKTKDIEDLLYFLVLCVDYLKGNLKNLLPKIVNLEEAYSNKGIHNINIRIFEIMILIDLGDSYFAELKIDALRKHIERHDILPRYLISYKILNQLQLQSFDFQKDNEKIEAFLQELRNEYKWRAYSFEAIRFETWFEVNKQKVDYWQLFEQEELQRKTTHN